VSKVRFVSDNFSRSRFSIQVATGTIKSIFLNRQGIASTLEKRCSGSTDGERLSELQHASHNIVHT
jgi:hypothetical protein